MGEGLPDLFAEVAAIGDPKSFDNCLKTSLSGILIEIVLPPPVTKSETSFFFLITIESGPGRKCCASK